MNELKVVARLLAQERGEAVRLTRERSYPLSDQPMVLVPIVMAGASPSLFALGIGDGIKPCHVHVCAEPRNRDQQYETLSRAASDMERFLHVWETDPEVMPQLITSGADASRLCLVTIHRMTYAQDLRIRLVGRRLHWLDRVFEQPESTALLDMPRAICELFATGQDECADAHLGAVLEWLKPADGQIYDRVLRVEDSPVSTATDPRLDNGKLIPLLQAVGQAEEKGDSSSSNRRRAEIKRIFHEEVGRRYDLIRQALSVCRRFPGSAGADYIQHQDRARYERNLAYVANPENLLATGLSSNAATSTFLARELRAEHLEGLMLRSVSGLRSVARLSATFSSARRWIEASATAAARPSSIIRSAPLRSGSRFGAVIISRSWMTSRLVFVCWISRLTSRARRWSRSSSPAAKPNQDSRRSVTSSNWQSRSLPPNALLERCGLLASVCR
jgi:hypothetical protein